MKFNFTVFRFLLRKRLLLIIMRTFIILFCTTVFSLNSGNLFSQTTISIEKDQLVTLNQVFRIIKKQTDYGFIFPKKLFKKHTENSIKERRN